ncbi:hypothetical protein MUDAN_DOGOELCO_03220 [Lactiplantibacillus mudanjiangensis]|nr:hypothetical protein MUDAN_DOGOELCO_03220 [Lactiplantibacillus mudanjiangensis]
MAESTTKKPELGKLTTHEKDGKIWGEVSIQDTKIDRVVQYRLVFPGFEAAAQMLDLSDQGRQPYWDAMMNGNEALGVSPMIQNPTINGKAEKMGWDYWKKHSGMLTVVGVCDRFLVDPLY